MRATGAGTEALAPDVVGAVLSYLGVSPEEPTLRLLDGLLDAYTRRVPWESAFRIARRARTARRADCPRWPREFWRDALERGGGGTCFESNYAFFSLLRALGYDGYLTINNMGDCAACHTAIVLMIEGEQWLADVGLPLYCALPLDPRRPLRRRSRFHTYTSVPDGWPLYKIMRDRHPRSHCYTLIDRPVPDGDYRQATEEDYGPGGHFLDRVIVNKVVGEVPWRFNGAETPFHLESFSEGRRRRHPFSGDDYVAELARHFAMDEAMLRVAFRALST